MSQEGRNQRGRDSYYSNPPTICSQHLALETLRCATAIYDDETLPAGLSDCQTHHKLRVYSWPADIPVITAARIRTTTGRNLGFLHKVCQNPYIWASYRSSCERTTTKKKKGRIPDSTQCNDNYILIYPGSSISIFSSSSAFRICFPRTSSSMLLVHLVKCHLS